jgi:hypothetical protein
MPAAAARADHGVGVGLRQRRGGEASVAPRDRSKQQSLGIAGKIAAVDIGVQIVLKIADDPPLIEAARLPRSAKRRAVV